jgi:hypothetical protein
MNWKEYNKFRTGLTFKQVRLLLKYEADRKYRNGEYMFITRHTVLGRWKEIKMKMFKLGLRNCNKKFIINHNSEDFIF